MTDLQRELENAVRVANESKARVKELEEQVRHLQMDITTTLVACSRCGRGWPNRYLVVGMCGDCAEKQVEVLRHLLKGRDQLLAAIPECPDHGECVPHAVEWVEMAKRFMWLWDRGKKVEKCPVG